MSFTINQQTPTTTITPEAKIKPKTAAEVLELRKQKTQEGQGFISKVGEGLSGRLKQAGESIGRTFRSEQTPMEMSLQMVGTGIGALTDVAGAALTSIPGVEKGLQMAGESVIKPAMETNIGQNAMDWYGGLSARTKANIGAGVNIASVLPVGKLLGMSGKTALKGAEKAANLAKTTLPKVVEEKAAQAAVKQADNLDNLFKASAQSIKKHADFAESRNISLGKEITNRKLDYVVDNDRLNFTPESRIKVEAEIEDKSKLVDAAVATYPTKVSRQKLESSVIKKIESNPTFKQEGTVEEMKAIAKGKINDYVMQNRRDYFTLPEIQNYKKGMASISKKYKPTDIGKSDAYSELASIFRQVVEDETPDVATRAINKEIGTAEELLKFLDKVERQGGIVLKGGKAGKYVEQLIGASTGAAIGTIAMGPVAGILAGMGGRGAANLLRSLTQKSAILGPLDRMLVKRITEKGASLDLLEAKSYLDKIKAGGKPTVSPSVEKAFKEMFDEEVKNMPKMLPAPKEGQIYPQINSQSTMPVIPAGKNIDYIGSGNAVKANQGLDLSLSQPSITQVNTKAITNPISSNVNSNLKASTKVEKSQAVAKIGAPIKNIYQDIKGGGITYNIPKAKNMAGEKAYAVSVFPNRASKPVKVADFTEADLEKFIRDNFDLLADEKYNVGGWVDNDQVYLDISKLFKNKNKAVKAGQELNQIAITDLEKIVSDFDNAFVSTGGTGEQVKLSDAEILKILNKIGD